MLACGDCNVHSEEEEDRTQQQNYHRRWQSTETRDEIDLDETMTTIPTTCKKNDKNSGELKQAPETPKVE
jgi:hypothetical protein